MSTISVAGIIGDYIPQSTRTLVVSSPPTIVCSTSTRRLLEPLLQPGRDCQWLPIAPVERCLDLIGERLEQGAVAIVVTGDPLFFGFGRLLRQRFAEQEIVFLPTLSAMQLCFAGFGLSWDDAVFLSLHGRPLQRLEQHLCSAKLFLFTDAGNSPDRVADFFLARFGPVGARRYRFFVGERLATSDQRFVSGTPAEIAGQRFAQPNCMIIQDTSNYGRQPPHRFGLMEREVRHSRGLITKDEVRAVVLHQLALPPSGVLWDIGAGSGSVGLEAARLCPGLSVYSIEQSPAEIANITTNQTRYGCWNLQPVYGTAPDILAGLPTPDRVFIGGSGGRLAEILEIVMQRAAVPTIIVLTAVTEATRTTAPLLLHSAGWAVTASTIAVRRWDYDTGSKTELNPIDVIRAEQRA